MAELLRTENLVKDYMFKGRMLNALDDVSISIYEGETLGLVGESGCGKSTLGKLIISLLEPTSGTIYYRGENIKTMDKARKKELTKKAQMIFQDPYASLDPRMSVGRIIEEPLLAHKVCPDKRERMRKVEELLSKVGLRAEYISRYPHQFSGGQRQRIGIARALALDPELVICDEPVSALDVSIQSQILNLLRELQEAEKLTYLFISHDLNVVRYLTDRVAVMFLGRICELAETDSLYSHPMHPYTSFLLSSVPRIDPRKRDEEIAIMTGEPASPIDLPSGCRFHTRCPSCDETCTSTAPGLVEAAPGRFVACHHPLSGQ